MTNYDKPFSVLMIDPPWLKKKGGLRKTRYGWCQFGNQSDHF